MLNVIKALYRVTGATFLKSGNLLNKLKEIDVESVLELADAYYQRTDKEKVVSEKAYLLGRLNKTKKPVYRIELLPHIVFFIGNEADILRKINDFLETKGIKQEKQDDKSSLDEEITF